MQVNRISSVQNQSGYITKKQKEEKSFKDVLPIEEENKEIEYDKVKVGGDGHIYGLVNGGWQRVNPNFNLEDTKCGPDEIVFIGDSIVKVGVNIVKNFGMRDNRFFAVQKDIGFSNVPNGLALVPGTVVNLPDGTILRWTESGVEYIPRPTNNPNEREKAIKYASSIASAMNKFTRIANKQAFGAGKVIGITKEKTQSISTVLRAMGIDPSKEFYVNGKKFMFDSASGEFKYDLENPDERKHKVRYVQGPRVRLAERH